MRGDAPFPAPASAPPLSGLFAAVVTPTTAGGEVNLEVFDRLVALLLDAGVDGICLGGATAEFPHATLRERLTLIQRASRLVGEDAGMVVGIGAAVPRDVVPLGEAALDAGARAVLLSMPLFFPYAQDDLEAFCRATAVRLGGSVLLYDLPRFTTPLDDETAVRLMREVPEIIGIKDSSGKPGRIAHFVAQRGNAPWRLMVGDDTLIPDALAGGWNGCIAGTAGVCPELVVALAAAVGGGDRDRATSLFALLRELIVALGPFPTPWGIRLGLAARGLDIGPLPLPPSARRVAQVRQFNDWFAGWLDRVGDALGRPLQAAPPVRVPG